jgi:lysophospholipase L1-like esterase
VRIKRLLLALALQAVVALALSAAVTAARADDSNATHYYLSLGDSLSVGVQPIGSGGQPVETNQGYPDELYALLDARDPKLQLVKLGCGGESTESMIVGSVDPSLGSSCGPPAFYLHRYPHKTQLAEAVAFLHAHQSHVSLVTIDIGGNDVLHGGGVSAIEANLPVILAALRDAAGPGVPIVGMTYYDPLLAGVWFSTFDLVALQVEANKDTLNGALENIYAANSDSVARVELAFSNNDTSIQPDGLPLDVDRICAWTWTCTTGGHDVHPNTQGYQVIANAYLNAIP